MMTQRLSRWLVALLAIATMATIGVAVWLFTSHGQEMRQNAERNLEAIAQLKRDQVALWRSQRLSDGAVLRDSPFFTRAVMDWLAGVDGGTEERIRQRLRSMLDHYGYAGAMLINFKGEVLLAEGREAHGLMPDVLAVLDDALAAGEPRLTDLHVDPDIGPCIDLVVPLSTGGQDGARPIGAVILQADARDSLYPLIQSWPTPSETAETWLVRREGEDVLFLNDLRFQEGAALSYREPLTMTHSPAVQAVLGETGVVYGQDYRGAEVMAAAVPIPDSPWCFVAKVDADEVLAGWRTRARLLIGMVVAALVALGALGVAVWQAMTAAQRKALLAAHEARRESEERYHLLTENAVNGIATHELVRDEDGNPVDYVYLSANPAFEAHTGLRPQDVIGRRVTEVIPGVEDAPYLDQYAQVVVTGESLIFENYFEPLGRYYHISAYKVAEEQFATVFYDITERVQAEQALRESEERYRALFENMMNPILMMDENGRYVDANEAGLEFLECTREELVGRSAWDYAPPGTLEQQQRDHALFVGRRTAETEYWVNGRVKTLLLNVVPVALPERVLLMGIGHDITERKALEDRLLQAQKMEAIGRLAGGVAHDFNNMLQVILGNTDMALAELSEGEFLHECLEEIRRAGERSADLTRQLLAFARKQIIAPRVLDLNDTVAGMLRMLRRLVGEEISLVWMPGADVSSIKMDPAQLDQILANLVINARDAIDGVGQVTIETANVEIDEAYATMHPDSVPGRYVMLAVTDDGRGMDKETLRHLFEPFFTTKPVGEGTGLGLATVYGIVRQNEGFVNVYSEPGQGTTFRIYFPQCEEERPELEEASAAPELPLGTGTVLLVEDEGALRSLGQRILERLGYTVLAASTPMEALQLSEEHEGDIVLLLTDVVMPQMNGRDLAERLQAQRPGLRCLYMSGYMANVIVDRGVVTEGTHFIQKPFTLEELAAKVREVLEA